MSVLTEEQVLDLTAAILDTNGIIYWRVKKWNEKQPTRPALPLDQFEPDWSQAPKNAKFWATKEAWLDIRGNEIACKFLTAHVKKPITPHPHAALMAKYAEVAARRPDPWVEFQFRVDKRAWETPTTGISFYPDFEYRYIGEPNAQ